VRMRRNGAYQLCIELGQPWLTIVVEDENRVNHGSNMLMLVWCLFGVEESLVLVTSHVQIAG
jgi:hypothetical protein